MDDRCDEVASLTFFELDRRASELAAVLRSRARAGARALMLYPPGLDFVVTFFGCLYADVVAVPLPLPRRIHLRDATIQVLESSTAELALTTARVLPALKAAFERAPEAARLALLATDVDVRVDAPWSGPSSASKDPRQVAFLQYTSGSTSLPKGVVVSHGNLRANLDMMSIVGDLWHSSTRVGWVPLHHDMGLILNVLQAVYVGATCVLMAPIAFLADPLSWLRAIHAHRAEMGVAPNFAYDLCVREYRSERMRGVDLSSWRLALNGAEPVRASTLESFGRVFAPHGFDSRALHPTYGMAEATLMISGGRRSDGPRLWSVSHAEFQRNRAVPPTDGERARTIVGCGRALPGERLAIVDPMSMRRRGPGEIGEIWVQGPHVAQGYWQLPGPTGDNFEARLACEGEGTWLRTGDLGCFDETGELYVTGRIKDIIILRGANYYPQDIELTIERSHAALRPGFGAVFVAEQATDDLLVVAYEIRRECLASLDVDDVAGAIRQGVVREHDLMVHRVVLCPPGTIPKTTSGKIRRRLARELWQGGKLTRLEPAHGTASSA